MHTLANTFVCMHTWTDAARITGHRSQERERESDPKSKEKTSHPSHYLAQDRFVSHSPSFLRFKTFFIFLFLLSFVVRCRPQLEISVAAWENYLNFRNSFVGRRDPINPILMKRIDFVVNKFDHSWLDNVVAASLSLFLWDLDADIPTNVLFALLISECH
jgi:hypothetical protein